MDKEAVLKVFGQNVRLARKALGLSQEQLALKVELDRTYISGIERGERNVGLFNIIRISRALDASPTQLFSGLEGADGEPDRVR